MRSNLLSLAAVALMGGSMPSMPSLPALRLPSPTSGQNRYMPHQGAREKARRVRQAQRVCANQERRLRRAQEHEAKWAEFFRAMREVYGPRESAHAAR